MTKGNAPSMTNGNGASMTSGNAVHDPAGTPRHDLVSLQDASASFVTPVLHFPSQVICSHNLSFLISRTQAFPTVNQQRYSPSLMMDTACAADQFQRVSAAHN